MSLNSILASVESALYSDANVQSNATSPKQADTKANIPGDITINEITLLSEDQHRHYNLMELAKSIEIFESMLMPVIFAEINIADHIGLLQNFPILCEEYISISFNTPGNNTPSKYLFRVNSITNKTVTDNNKMASYTLQLVSAELLRNASAIVEKKCNDSIDNIVSQILKDELTTQKPVEVDKTKGIEDVLITKMPPLKAIDFLRQRAVSPEYKSSSFVFYESKSGFHFTTIEKKMANGNKVQDNIKQFFFDTVRKENSKAVSQRNIISYAHHAFADAISKIQFGGLTNIVNAYDMITGNIKRIEYNDNQGQDQFKFADKNSSAMNTTSYSKNHGKNTTVYKFVPTSADKPQTDRPQMLSISRAYAQSIAQNIAHIYVYGDSSVDLGEIIECSFPKATTLTDDTTTARIDTGNYMVSKIRHSILNTDRPQHSMSLELIRGGLTET